MRTKKFALRVIRLYSSLPKGVEAAVIGKQLLRFAILVSCVKKVKQAEMDTKRSKSRRA